MRNESIGTLNGDRIARTSARSLSENTYDNFLQIDQEDVTKILSNRNLRASARTNERQARRNSIMKSLAVLDIDDEETDLFNSESMSFDSECESVSGSSSCGSESSAAKQRRYLRRGSVTKHKFEAEVNGLQPNSLSLRLTTSAEDEGAGGYANGGDYGSDSDAEMQRKRRYLRRGSVTKYSLDAHVSKIQPTSIMENKANNPRRTLPPPPKPTSNRSVQSEATPSTSSSSGSGLGSRPPMAPSHTSSQSQRPPSSANPNDAADSGHGVRRKLKSSSTSSAASSASKSKNLDDSGHRQKSKNLEDSDHSKSTTTSKSKNLDDSGHKIKQSLSESEPESTNLDDSLHKRASSLSSKSKNLDDSGHKGAATKSKSLSKSKSLANHNNNTTEKRPSERSSGSSTPSSSKTKMTIGNGGVGGSHAVGRSSIWIKTHSTSSVSSEDSEEFASASASYPTETKKSHPPPTEKISSLVARKVRGSSFNKSRHSNSTPGNLKTAPISPTTPALLFSPSGKRIKSILSHGPHKKQLEFKKSVRFGDLVITEFPIILGDNPAVTMGAPVTIDWEAQGEVSYKINVYESIRGTRRRRRKLLISVSNRAILLLAAGYSIDDIADASINAQQIKFGRQESMQNQAWDRVNMMMETSRGAVGSVGTLMEGTVGTVGTIMGGTVGTVGTLMGGTVGSVGTLMGDTGKKIRAIVKPMRVSESARSA
jgi:hypothetical protein